MKPRVVGAILAAAILLLACGKPTDIVFGPEPLKQMSEQGEQFKKLPEDDRLVLAGYLAAIELGKAFGAAPMPVTGRTVGEVLVDAKAWRQKIQAAEAEAKRRQAEEAALKAKVLAERKQIAEKIAASVTVAVTDKRVLPKNFNVGRYSEMLVIQFAVENKSARAIRQLKGRVSFFDATGDTIGSLLVDFDERIEPNQTLKTDTGGGWKLNPFLNSNIEKIAGRDFASMTTKFEAEAVAFDGGEVLRAPESK